MPYIDETSKEEQTVERLIRFMKAVENPEWMIDLVKDMRDKIDKYESMPVDIINKLEEAKNPIYRNDGSLMAKNTGIKIDDVISIVQDVCSLDAEKVISSQIIKKFKDYLFTNDIELEDGGDFTIISDIISGLIKKHNLKSEPAKDTDIKDLIEDEIMESLYDVLIKGGYANPISTPNIIILRNTIWEAFTAQGIFLK